MRFLFLSYSFPGPLGAMASWLGSQSGNQVIMASTRAGREAPLANVQRALLKKYPARKRSSPDDYFDGWAEAIRAGMASRASLEAISASGFGPDMIFCASSNGAALNLDEIFPAAFIVNFLEAENFPRADRIRRDIRALQILKAHVSFAFSQKAVFTLYPHLRHQLQVIAPMIDCGFYAPARKIRNSLLMLCDSNPELYLNLALQIRKIRPEASITIICRNSYSWRQLREYRPKACDISHLRITGDLSADSTRDLLASSPVAIISNSSQTLAEALACGCAVMTLDGEPSDHDAWLTVSSSDSDQITQTLADLLADASQIRLMGKYGREIAKKNFCLEKRMPQFFNRLCELLKNR